MRLSKLLGFSLSIVFVIGAATAARAQSPEPQSEGRQSAIEKAAAEKAKALHPYKVTFGEKVIAAIERPLTNQAIIRWHPFLESAYEGGGLAAGLGHTFHTSAYSTFDVRGSYSINSSKLAEAEFISPRLFDRRGELTIRGGWRDATAVAFNGIGINASNRLTNYGFEQPFGSAMLTIRPARRGLLLRGGVEASRWDLKSGTGTSPSVDDVYTPESLPGLGPRTTFVHTQATVGFDSRHSRGYTRRGGFYGITGHDYTDRDDALGFQQVDYEAIQHIPILREAWVVSLRGRVTTTFDKQDQTTPFYMLPSLGGGSSLRGFTSFRFSDRQSMLLQAEWRIMANRFVESSVFYDAGKVAARTSDLDLRHLKSDYGFGLRIHAPMVTVLRIDVARSTEGTRLVFAASPAF